LSIEDGRTRPQDHEPGNVMLGFLKSPVGWTLIILILSSLGIFRELF
jgi:hypothetical protein